MKVNKHVGGGKRKIISGLTIDLANVLSGFTFCHNIQIGISCVTVYESFTLKNTKNVLPNKMYNRYSVQAGSQT